jgi:hypothetical protein
MRFPANLVRDDPYLAPKNLRSVVARLENIRRELVLSGKEINRPPIKAGDPSEAGKWVLGLIERLLRNRRS